MKLVQGLLIVAIAGMSCKTFARDPTWMPAQSCKEAWGSMISKGAHNYDYAKDVKKGPDGNEGYQSYAARIDREHCYKDFTVLVYMAADNDLSTYALLDLYEMESGYKGGERLAGSTVKLDLIVQADTADDHGKVRRLHMFQSPEPYDPSTTVETLKGKQISDVRSPVVEFLDESKMNNAEQSFREFLKWGVRKYPAKNYAVIVWGHGQGWTAGPLAANTNNAKPQLLTPHDAEIMSNDVVRASNVRDLKPVFGGIALDSSTGDRLSIPALNHALASVVSDELQGNPFALYISDACLMQMAEVASEIADSTRFIVGSTQVQDFMGLPYRRILSEINSGKFSGIEDVGNDLAFRVAKMIPKVFRASMTPTGLQGRNSPNGIKFITLSSLSSSEIQYSLRPAMKRLAAALNAYVSEDAIRQIDLAYAVSKVPGFQGGAQEIGAFLYLVETALNKEMRQDHDGEATESQKELQSAIVATRVAVGKTVINRVLGTNYTTAEEQLYLLGIKAFSMWLPASKEEFNSRIEDFERSDFYRQNPDWDRFLKKLFSN